MRYQVRFEGERHRWTVVDTFLADQVLGLHESEHDAIVHADTQERHWGLFRSPAEEVALIVG